MIRILLCILLLLTGSLAWALPNQFVQEGYLTTQNGAPLNGAATLRVRMYAFAIGGQVLFEEVHEDVPLINGYYAIMVGSIEPLPDGIFQNAEVFFGLKVNDGDELRPLTPIAKVPAAMVADTATNVRHYTENRFNRWCNGD